MQSYKYVYIYNTYYVYAFCICIFLHYLKTEFPPGAFLVSFSHDIFLTFRLTTSMYEARLATDLTLKLCVSYSNCATFDSQCLDISLIRDL
jgi:hypothetical protein